jgi:hypothetical protein
MMSDMNREIKQQAKIMAAGARLHGLLVDLCFFSWGSRPRLYAAACFAGSKQPPGLSH